MKWATVFASVKKDYTDLDYPLIVISTAFVDGGRLFSVVAEGTTPLDAKQLAYEAMSYISIEGNNLHFRTDIGWRDIDRALRARD